MWFPLGFGTSLGLGCMTGLSGVNIVHVFCFGQGVRVTFYARGGSRTAPTGKGGPARRGLRLQEGWLPASAGMTDGEGVGGFLGTRRICGGGPPPARPFDPPQPTYSMLRVSGPSQGWIHGRGASSIGGWHACRRLSAGMTRGEGRGVWGPQWIVSSGSGLAARPFDSAQGERPHPGDGFTPRRIFDRLGGRDDGYAKVT